MQKCLNGCGEGTSDFSIEAVDVSSLELRFVVDLGQIIGQSLGNLPPLNTQLLLVLTSFP